MQEKQKVRILYGLNEKQFHKVFDKASKMHGIAGENLLILLESRLDNMVYRLGMARTRISARQIVNHGHPSYTTKVGDIISVKENSLNHPAILDSIEQKRTVPAYLEMDEKKLSGKFVRLPERSELNPEINEQLIVEFYNR